MTPAADRNLTLQAARVLMHIDDVGRRVASGVDGQALVDRCADHGPSLVMARSPASIM